METEEAGIAGQPDEPDVACGEGAVQGGEGVLVRAEAGMDDGLPVGRDVARGGAVEEFAGDGGGLGRASALREGVCQGRHDAGVWDGLQDVLELGDRLVETAGLLIGEAEAVVGGGEFRFDVEDAESLFGG